MLLAAGVDPSQDVTADGPDVAGTAGGEEGQDDLAELADDPELTAYLQVWQLGAFAV